jgi:hypothetical protein
LNPGGTVWIVKCYCFDVRFGDYIIIAYHVTSYGLVGV